MSHDYQLTFRYKFYTILLVFEGRVKAGLNEDES